MQLTMKQMQYQILIAYQMNKAKNDVQIKFGHDYRGRQLICLYEYENKGCKFIEIYEFHKLDQKKEIFMSIIAVLNGDKSLFNETVVERETRATEELF